jgi:DNA-binding GntR family transcriptional regulator
MGILQLLKVARTAICWPPDDLSDPLTMRKAGTVADTTGALPLTDSVAAALRRQVIGGELQPGLRITEGWVAERFGVARPTAKTGLDLVIAEGLLRRGPRRSATVPLLSAADIDDIYLSREPVESLAVMMLAKSRQIPDAAERALAHMLHAAERSAHPEHTEADVEFHYALVEATGSPRLARMHRTVMGEAQLCIAQIRQHALLDLRELTALHAAILDAIRDGDPVLAAAALRADLDGCRETLLVDVARKIAV